MFIFRGVLVVISALLASCDQNTCPVCLNFKDASNMELALIGFDPIMDDPTKYPNPGHRGQLFEPYTQLQDGRLRISPFITKALDKHHCTPKFETKLLKNYNQYKDSKSLFTSTDVEPIYVVSDPTRSQVIDNEETKLRKFFQETNGEIITISNECVTNVIEVANYVTPSFTHSFAEALRSVHYAAKNPLSTESVEAYIRFVNTFGTHYLQKISLGNKICFEKRFAKKSRNPAEEIRRKRCVRTAVHAAVAEGFDDIVAAEDVFSLKSQSCSSDSTECSGNFLERNGLPSEKVTLFGSIITKNTESFEKTSFESVPVAYELRTMSSMFSNLQFNVGPVNQEGLQENFNGTFSSIFFNQMTSRYCNLILGRNCTAVSRRGCGLNSLCTVREQCVDDISGSLGYHCHAVAEGAAPRERPRDLVNGALHKPVTGTPAHYALLRSHGIYTTLGQVTNGDVSNVNTFYHSPLLVQPFLVVDLGEVMSIWGVRIMPGKYSYHPDRFRDISIRTGMHAVPGPSFNSYTEIFLFAGPHGNPATWIEHNLSAPLCGRYVSLQRTKSGASYLEVLELEVLVEV